jgi:hypothetical protein
MKAPEPLPQPAEPQRLRGAIQKHNAKRPDDTPDAGAIAASIGDVWRARVPTGLTDRGKMRGRSRAFFKAAGSLHGMNGLMLKPRGQGGFDLSASPCDWVRNTTPDDPVGRELGGALHGATLDCSEAES